MRDDNAPRKLGNKAVAAYPFTVEYGIIMAEIGAS
jgi:hypothetical protein